MIQIRVAAAKRKEEDDQVRHHGEGKLKLRKGGKGTGT